MAVDGPPRVPCPASSEHGETRMGEPVLAIRPGRSLSASAGPSARETILGRSAERPIPKINPDKLGVFLLKLFCC